MFSDLFLCLFFLCSVFFFSFCIDFFQGGSIESQAEFCLAMSKFCDAVVVLTCQLAGKEESDEVWTQNAKKLLGRLTLFLILFLLSFLFLYSSPFCDAVVVITCQLTRKEESDEVWVQLGNFFLSLFVFFLFFGSFSIFAFSSFSSFCISSIVVLTR